MESVILLAEVLTFETRRGGVRYVGRDTGGKEYTTFRQDIGERAKQLEHRRVRIEYHEEQRGPYKNVYLDKIEPAGTEAGEPTAGTEAGEPTAGTEAGEPTAGTDAQEAAWRTAVEAAPWLVGEPRQAVPPDELYGKLKPFEDQVAADIERQTRDDPDRDEP